MSKSTIQTIKRICDDALKGNLKLRDFHVLWPEEANDQIVFRQVYDDLEDLIEHTPFYLFSRNIKYDKFYNSDAYLRVYLDRAILEHCDSIHQMERCRDSVLSHRRISKEAIEHCLKTCID